MVYTDNERKFWYMNLENMFSEISMYMTSIWFQLCEVHAKCKFIDTEYKTEEIKSQEEGKIGNYFLYV